MNARTALFLVLLAPLSLRAQMPAHYLLAERGPNHRLWLAPPDPATGKTHAPVVELRSGMHYWDAQRNDWVESEPVFTDTGEAFIANRIQHSTRLSHDIYVLATRS